MLLQGLTRPLCRVPGNMQIAQAVSAASMRLTPRPTCYSSRPLSGILHHHDRHGTHLDPSNSMSTHCPAELSTMLLVVTVESRTVQL